MPEQYAHSQTAVRGTIRFLRRADDTNKGRIEGEGILSSAVS